MARRQTLSGVTRVNNARLIGGCGARRLRRLSALLRPGPQSGSEIGVNQTIKGFRISHQLALLRYKSLQIAVPYATLARFISDLARRLN